MFTFNISVVIGFIFIALSACSSFRSTVHEGVQPSDVPVAIQPMFASCSPSDGEVQMSVQGRDTHINGINVVWNIPDERTWEIQFNSPMGDTRLALQRKNGQFSTIGDIQLEVGVDSRGFIAFNDHLLPLQDNELPCVLAGRWPVTWLDFLQRVDRSRTQFKLLGHDDVRTIGVTTSMDNDGGAAESCAVIQWGGFLGLFRHEAELCMKRSSGGFTAELKAPSNYIAKWSQSYDES